MNSSHSGSAPHKTDSREADKFVVRLPDGLREKVADLAAWNNRSMNSEIVYTLKNRLTIESYARQHTVEKMALVHQIDSLNEMIGLLVSDDLENLELGKTKAKEWLKKIAIQRSMSLTGK
ncbi:MAG: Arc family DNA-binding protein [Hafnia sp.]